MKHNLTLLTLVLLCGQSFGDTLILKGGKKVEWKALRDKGDSYEVELLNGTVQTVAKKDVEKIDIFDAQPVLAGAAISFVGKTRTAELLGAVAPKRDVVFGVVKGGAQGLQILSEIDAPTILRIPYKLPDEYDLSIIIERKSEIGNFYIGLTSGDRQFLLEFDGDRGSYSQFCGGPGRRGQALERGKRKDILVQVRRTAVVVTVDKKEFLVHQASPAGLFSPHQLPNGETGLFLGTQRIYGNAENANFVVYRLAAASQP